MQETACILNEKEYWGRLLQCKKCGHVQIAGPPDWQERCRECAKQLVYRTRGDAVVQI